MNDNDRKREIGNELALHVRNFLEEVDKLCERFGLSISHEDCQGGFIIEPYYKANIEWLKQASVCAPEMDGYKRPKMEDPLW
jgi:hypothetical protein